MSGPEGEEGAAGNAAPAEPREPLSPVQRLLHALPDLAIGLVFLLVALDRVSHYELSGWVQQVSSWRPPTLDDRILWITVFLEGAFLWPQTTLVDIATRIRRRPPWWAIPIIVLGVLIFVPGPGNLLPLLMDPTSTAFVPVMVSIWQRAQMLWTLPGKPALERERARAIMGGRLNIAIAVAAPVMLFELGRGIYNTATGSLGGFGLLQDGITLYFVVAVYFLVVAFDQWRVGGVAFARKPTPFLWFDYVGVRDHTHGF